MLRLRKNNYCLSFHFPIFHSKIHKHLATFFEREMGNSLGNSSEYMLRGEEGTYKMNRDEQGGRRVGQKFEVSRERTF